MRKMKKKLILVVKAIYKKIMNSKYVDINQIHGWNEVEALVTIFARAFLQTSSKMKRDIIKSTEKSPETNLVMFMDENEELLNGMYFKT